VIVLRRPPINARVAARRACGSRASLLWYRIAVSREPVDDTLPHRLASAILAQLGATG